MTKRIVLNLDDNTSTEETFTYDAAGNITADDASVFVYDTNNRLTQCNENPVSLMDPFGLSAERGVPNHQSPLVTAAWENFWNNYNVGKKLRYIAINKGEKMSTRKTLWIVGIVVLSVVVSVLIILGLISFLVSLPWLPIITDSVTDPNPPEPKIQYAEFPFTLVYEIDGEVITVQDAYVCEFAGYAWNEGQMEKFRTWKKHLKSNPAEEAVLLTIDGDAKIYCNFINPQYHMGDVDEFIGNDLSNYNPQPIVYRYVFPNETGGVSKTRLDDDEILEKYKIRIIGFEISDPIENSFSDDPIDQTTGSNIAVPA